MIFLDGIVLKSPAINCLDSKPTLKVKRAVLFTTTTTTTTYCYTVASTDPPRGGFLKISIPIGIPTYAGMKSGFHADVSPEKRFPCRRQP